MAKRRDIYNRNNDDERKIMNERGKYEGREKDRRKRAKK